MQAHFAPSQLGGPRKLSLFKPARLLGLAVTLGLAAPTSHAIEYAPFQLGALEVIPNFNTTVTPTGSVLQPNGEEESAELLLFKPRVTAVLRSDRQRYASTLEVQNGNFSAAGTTSYVDWKLENNARFALNDSRSLQVHSEHLNSHEGAGSASAYQEGREAARFSASTLNASFEQSLWHSRGQLVLDSGRYSKAYFDTAERNDLLNSVDHFVGGSFRFRVFEGADLQLQYRARDMDQQAARDGASATERREIFSYVGAAWERDLSFAGKMRVSSGYKQTSNHAETPLPNHATWETNLRWQPLTSATLTFAADQTSRFTPGASEATNSSSYRYHWEQRWAQQLKTTVAGSYSANINASTKRVDEGMGLKLRLEYAYSTWVDMFVALGHDRRETAGAFSFTQQTFVFGIAASFDRLFGRR